MADEKTYVSDIPRLMDEWNWEKNVGIDPHRITVGSGKKFGGNVKTNTNGKQVYLIEIKDGDARIVQVKESLTVKMIYNLPIRLWQKNGITKEITSYCQLE